MATLIRPVARTDSRGVAALLGELGYPCDTAQAAARIDRDCAGGSGTLVAADPDALLGLIFYEACGFHRTSYRYLKETGSIG